MKHLWMIVAILSLIAAIHRTVVMGFKESYIFYIFVLVALLMFWIRSYMSKKEKNNKN
jgi:4-hydroxybenzoate polyprenyltransferase